MRYVLVILPSLLVGCIAGMWLGYESAQIPPLQQTMPESAQARSCESVREFNVLQATREGALAFACESVGAKHCSGQLAFIPNQRNIEFFDDQRVRVAQGQCFVFDGVHRYTNREGRERTVPIAWIRNR